MNLLKKYKILVVSLVVPLLFLVVKSFAPMDSLSLA